MRYYYTNDKGYNKMVDIGEKTEKGYHFAIWSADYGDLCGAGYKTEEELKEFCEHYGIKRVENE